MTSDSTGSSALDTDSPEVEIFRVAADIAAWQKSAEVSDNKLIKQFPDLGSTKTFKKLSDKKDATSLDVASWLPKYRSVLFAIKTATGSQHNEAVYTELGTAHKLLQVGSQLLAHKGINRWVMIEGDSGSGKSTALGALCAAHPGKFVRVSGSTAWKKPVAMLCDMLVALGAAKDPEELPMDAFKLERRLFSTLRLRGVSLAIDEAQHMSVDCLNVVKNAMNETPAAVVMAGQNTLWRRVQNAFWAEAKQLRHNRCFAYLVFGAPTDEDLKIYVTKRAKPNGLEKLTAATWKALTDGAASHGNFGYLRDVIALAKTLVPDGEPLDDSALVNAAQDIAKRAGGK